MEHIGKKFADRHEAGVLLSEELKLSLIDDPVVIALPRGGVAVADPIATEFKAPLELIFVKKITAPGHPEVAIGAIAEDGPPEWQDLKVHSFNVEPEDQAHLIKKAVDKIHQQRRLWGSVNTAELKGKTAIIVDDGLATGATLFAAVNYLKSKNPKKIVVALPVASHSALGKLKHLVDEVVCLKSPDRFSSVSQVYDDFTQMTDQEVGQILFRHHRDHAPLSSVAEAIKKVSFPFKAGEDGEKLLKELAGARVVMFGEATHGTEDFYRIRRLLSERLIEQYGFKFIAVEGDWPDCWKLNDYIQHGRGGRARTVMQEFKRWPTWMWANYQTANLIEWMADNGGAFYGLDVYSMYESMDVVRRFAKENLSPHEVENFLKFYSCFDPYDQDEKAYARSLHQLPEGCRLEVLAALKAALKIRIENTRGVAPEIFNAQQNALVVKNAERYYRAMMSAEEESWNVRDEHMMETLDNLLQYHGEGSKAIVWAHNTHVGDYRATDMVKNGYVNLGGLARQRYGLNNVKLVGFGTYKGKVVAGRAWDARAEAMLLKPARKDTIEHFFHEVCENLGSPQICANLNPIKSPELVPSFGHRAIGVVYHPSYEEYGHNYVPTSLAQRYDHFIFVDQTLPLKYIPTHFDHKEIPETWPSGV